MVNPSKTLFSRIIEEKGGKNTRDSEISSGAFFARLEFFSALQRILITPRIDRE